jgi:hypothetical protein
MQWLGVVAALEEGLRHIAAKKRQPAGLRRSASQGEASVEALS